MEQLHLPNNIKVHYAACEVMNQFVALDAMGISYGLYTCFPFVERMVFKKALSPLMPLRWMKNPAMDIPHHIHDRMRHVIQDSGLFTLLFGSRKDIDKSESTINLWYDALVEYTLSHGLNVTCVEVDCQNILGVDKAWEFRERIRKDLPNNRIINVFHLIDGKYGLDRMIEFSDYIALSVPEMRMANLKQYVPSLARYIKDKKPSIDIHLLGCTELSILKQCRFCTTCDSSTYTSAKRYGCIEENHISKINTQKVKDYFGEDVYNKINEYNNEQNTNTLCVCIENLKRKYQRFGGYQDYKLNYKQK